MECVNAKERSYNNIEYQQKINIEDVLPAFIQYQRMLQYNSSWEETDSTNISGCMAQSRSRSAQV